MANEKGISEAQMRAVSKYNKKAYDRLEMKVPKGQGEDIKSHAKQMGESLNAFLQRAVKEAIERDLNT